MTTNHPDPTPPTSPAAVSAPLRLVEDRDCATCGGTGTYPADTQDCDECNGSGRVAAKPRWTDLFGIAPNYPKSESEQFDDLVTERDDLLARLRAAEETLAAVRILAEAARAALPHATYTGVSWASLLDLLDAAALAEGASR